MKTLLATVSLAAVLSLSSTTIFARDHHQNNNGDYHSHNSHQKHNKYDDNYRSRKNHQKHGNFDDNYRSRNSHQKMARVTHVEPIYRTVRYSTPQRYQHHTGDRYNQSYTSTIAGSLIGGVIGNQFGKGNGKTVMTIAGTLLGGSVGRDVGHHQSSQATLAYNHRDRRDMKHVSNRYQQQQRLDGYRVNYKYRGQTYTTHMDHHPGKRIPINVSVSPDRHYY